VLLTMQNYNLLDHNTIQLPSGVFAGVEKYDTYPDGELLGIRLSARNMLLTHIGELVPAYTETHRRKVKYAVEFYKNGMIKTVALDEVQEITSPIGEFPAELVTFYETGELKRFFPLDGKISGMWSEEEEKSLAIPLSFELPFAAFTAIIVGVAFYREGDIKSLTLFPGETVNIATKYGEIPTRHGFSLYETGELESLEPAVSYIVDTPIGRLAAFDPNAVGINADYNSLVFDKAGAVRELVTVHNRVAAQTAEGRLLTFGPREVVNPLDDETMITEGLKIVFDYEAETVTFASGGEECRLSLADCGFTVTAYSGAAHICSPVDCASCSLGCR
jgi:hypothetical protein